MPFRCDWTPLGLILVDKMIASLQAGPLPVANGVITPIHGPKEMDNWGYDPTYRGPITPFITGFLGPPCREFNPTFVQHIVAPVHWPQPEAM